MIRPLHLSTLIEHSSFLLQGVADLQTTYHQENHHEKRNSPKLQLARNAGDQDLLFLSLNIFCLSPEQHPQELIDFRQVSYREARKSHKKLTIKKRKQYIFTKLIFHISALVPDFFVHNSCTMRTGEYCRKFRSFLSASL